MKRRAFLAGSSAIVLVAASAYPAQGDESKWGHLSGRFVYGGEPPEPVRLEITKDVALVKVPLFDESLLVDKENRGLANVVVTLLPGKAADMLGVHPSYEMAKSTPAETTYRDFKIEPRVTVLRTGQQYVHVNVDPVGHNPKIDLWNNTPPSEIVPIGRRQRISNGYKSAEPTPVQVSCAIHPWEVAVLVVTDHPYVGVSQSDGSFVIKNLPVGQWTFRLWHERGGWIKQLTVAGQAQKLERGGKLTVEIKPGANDLGEIKIEPKLLERNR